LLKLTLATHVTLEKNCKRQQTHFTLKKQNKATKQKAGNARHAGLNWGFGILKTRAGFGDEGGLGKQGVGYFWRLVSDGGKPARTLAPTKLNAWGRGPRLRAFQAQKDQLDAQRVAQLNKSPHRLLNIRGLQHAESATGLDFPLLPIPGTGHPSPEGVPTSRMPVQTLRNRYIRRSAADMHAELEATLEEYRRHSRGLKKADLWVNAVKDFNLAGIRDVNLDVTLRQMIRGIPRIVRQPYAQWGTLTPRRKRRTGRRQGEARQPPTCRNYNELRFFFLPAVMTP
jgi:hypothetical protein